MKRRSKDDRTSNDTPSDEWEKWREGIIGLGEKSSRKTYYAELQRQMEELERFKALVDQSHEAILLIEAATGRLADVNATACRWLDCSKEEVLCMNISEIVHENTSKILKQLFNEKEMVKDSLKTITTFVLGPSQKKIPVDMSIRLVDFVNTSYFVAVARDITERTRMQKERELILENVPVGIVFTRGKRIVWINRGIRELFGYSHDELMAITIISLFKNPREYKTFKDNARNVLLSGHRFVKELKMKRKDNRLFWCQLNVKSANNKNISQGVIWIVEDIRQRKKAEEELKKLNKELEKRVKVRTAELARANKEIKTLNEQLQDENMRMHTEMQLAKRIQTSLLPPTTKNIHKDFEISAVMIPAEEVGGDFYEITTDKSDNLWFAVGDVSGHGVTPGLIMMMAQTVLLTINSLLESDARDLVIRVNEVLYKNVCLRLTQSYFMSFSALKYLGEGKFEYAGAHLDMIIYRHKSGLCELLKTPGTFLLFIPDITHATVNNQLVMEQGDILVLYTDGFIEARNNLHKMLDITGFKDLVKKHAHKKPEQMKQALIKDVLDFCGGLPDDDMSLIIIKRK